MAEPETAAMITGTAVTTSMAPNNMPYIFAIVIMTVVGFLAISAIVVMLPNRDNTLVITAIVGFLTTTTVSLLAFMKVQETNLVSKETNAVARETHLSVNSRLDAFIRAAELGAFERGIREGTEAGRQQANERTDTLRNQPPPPTE